MNKHFRDFLVGIDLEKHRWDTINEHEFCDMLRRHRNNSTFEEDGCVQCMIEWYRDTEETYKRAEDSIVKLVTRTACFSEARLWVEMTALHMAGWKLVRPK